MMFRRGDLPNAHSTSKRSRHTWSDRHRRPPLTRGRIERRVPTVATRGPAPHRLSVGREYFEVALRTLLEADVRQPLGIRRSLHEQLLRVEPLAERTAHRQRIGDLPKRALNSTFILGKGNVAIARLAQLWTRARLRSLQPQLGSPLASVETCGDAFSWASLQRANVPHACTRRFG
jgi:hypothetical protein